MKIIEYLQQKYLLDSPTVLTAAEAKAFGIQYPLKKGWLGKHGDRQINSQMRDIALFRLDRKVNGGIRAPNDNSPYHQRGIDILKGIKP